MEMNFMTAVVEVRRCDLLGSGTNASLSFYSFRIVTRSGWKVSETGGGGYEPGNALKAHA